MFKFQATDRWYREAAAAEGNYDLLIGSDLLVRHESNKTILIDDVQVDAQQQADILQVGFRVFMRKMRLQRGLSLSDLAKRLDVDLEQLILIEQKIGYKPAPRTLVQIASFYNIPLAALMQMVGATRKTDKSIEEHVVRFAAESENFEILSKQERRLLDELVAVLRDFTQKR